MTNIASRASASRIELKRLKEKLGPGDPAVQRMRAVVLAWIAELQEERRLEEAAPKSKTG